MIRVFLLLLAVFNLFACQTERDLREYYFPVRELVNEDGLVYVYQNIGSQPGPDTLYTYNLGVDQDTALYLSQTRYGPDLSPRQQSRLRLYNDGMRLEQLSLLEPDSNGISQETRTKLLYGRTFNFYPERGEANGYHLTFDAPGTAGGRTLVTLNRRFVGDTTLFVLGRERPAVRFDLEGEVSRRDPTEGDISPTFGGYEIYARDIGLVEHLRDLGAAGSIGGRLVERVPMAEFVGRQRR